jgi:YedE family putative selenium metabolism protein
MSAIGRFLSSRGGIVITGIVVGVLAPVLVKLGNPANMGVCVACFSRDIAGALGLHRAAAVQYIRPEIIGFILGSLVAALIFREFRPRTGASPLAKFLLGALAMIGALVFLGCPWRAFLRLSGGDWNALLGILGLVAGIAAGTALLRMGFNLGRSHPAPQAVGWIMPALMIALLVLLVLAPQLGRDPEGKLIGPIFFSAKGPGSQHALLWISLGAGLLIGFLAQRSRFCTVGAVRDLILMKSPNMFSGIAALILTAFITNLALGQFKPGFAGQPIAHSDGLWNFAGMLLAGLAFTMAGGCPGRQVFLSGEGDGDAAIFVVGMIVGAAFAHNFNLASSPTGPSPYGPAAVIIGILACLVLGLSMREKAA